VRSVYAPNGRTPDDPHYAYKLRWLEALRAAVAPDAAGDRPFALMGDFNVAPADADVWDPAAFVGATHVTPAERAALAALRETGLTEGRKMSVILLVSGYVRNEAIMEAQITEAVRAAGTTDQQAMLDYNQILGLVTDGQHFPELSRVVASGVLAQADPWDDEFVFGLDRILDGIGTLLDNLPQPG